MQQLVHDHAKGEDWEGGGRGGEIKQRGEDWERGRGGGIKQSGEDCEGETRERGVLSQEKRTGRGESREMRGGMGGGGGDLPHQHHTTCLHASPALWLQTAP